MDTVIKRSVKLTLFLVLAAAAVFVCLGKWRFAAGIVVGAAWSGVNVLVTIGLLKMAVLKKENSQLPAFLLLKFPLLYLTGFLILYFKFFPVASVLVGLTAVLPVLGIVNLWPKRTPPAPSCQI